MTFLDFKMSLTSVEYISINFQRKWKGKKLPLLYVHKIFDDQTKMGFLLVLILEQKILSAIFTLIVGILNSDKIHLRAGCESQPQCTEWIVNNILAGSQPVLKFQVSFREPVALWHISVLSFVEYHTKCTTILSLL